jgi:Na+/melibiose symporter-like transporter
MVVLFGLWNITWIAILTRATENNNERQKLLVVSFFFSLGSAGVGLFVGVIAGLLLDKIRN